MFIRQPRVDKVIDNRTGKLLSTQRLLRLMSEQEKHELRAVQLGPEKALVYACPVCSQSVYLSGTGKADSKIYHFRHFPNAGDCPIKDSENLSKEALLSLMYNGVKESKQHKNLKKWLGNFLQSIEPSGEFSEVRIEKRFTSKSDKMSWRQPDVSCVYNGNRLVFELQLNPTFVEVIRGREQFYQAENTYICWLFDEFDPQNTDLSERDIFWLNKSNAFVISEKSMKMSEKMGMLYVECHYLKPSLVDDVIQKEWVSELLPFSSLSLDNSSYKPFFFDSDKALNALQKDGLVLEFLSYLLGGLRDSYDYHQRIAKEEYYLSRFSKLLPEFVLPKDVSKGFINIVDALYFLKYNDPKMRFNSFDNIKRYVEQILTNYPEFGCIFFKAIPVYRPKFSREELGVKLKPKYLNFWEDINIAKAAGVPNGQEIKYNPILELLFPELSALLRL